MSQENVEIVRESSELFNRGEFDRWLEYFDPGIVFEPLRASMQGPYHGHTGIREWLADNRENFAEFRLDIAEIRDIGEDRVLYAGSLHFRGKGSGVETEAPTGAIVQFRNGTAVHLKDYGDRGRALQAVGLSE
jgi:ketosteroid isomerase-like protein